MVRVHPRSCRHRRSHLNRPHRESVRQEASTEYRLVESTRQLRPGSVEAQRHRLQRRRLSAVLLRHQCQSHRCLLVVLLRHRLQSHRLSGLLRIVFVRLTTSLPVQAVRVA